MFDTRTIRTSICVLIGAIVLPCATMAQAIGQDAAQAFQLGAGHYERGEWDDATESFEAIIQNHAGTNEADIAHFFLGEALMQREEFQKAYLAWQNYLGRQPNGEFASRATFRMGEAAMRLELFPQSIRLLEAYVDEYPGDSLMQFALAYLGEMRLTRDEPQLAQRVFEAALRLQPGGHIANQCRFGLARSLQIQGNATDALNFYDFIIQDPENPLRDAAMLESGIIHFASDRNDQALSRLTPIVESFDRTTDRAIHTKAHYWLGRIALTRDNFTLALDHFRQLDYDSVDSDIAIAAWFDGAIAATRAGDRQQAEQWLTRLIDEFPDHELVDDAMFMQLRNAFDEGDSSSGSKLAEAFLTRHTTSPFRPQVNELLGQLAYQNERYDETVQRFTALLDTKPDSSDAHQVQRLTWSYYVALGKIGLEQFEQAETILQSLASADELRTESGPKSLSTLVQIALATARFSLGKHDLAIANYEAYLSIVGWDNESTAAQHELVLCYAQTGRWQNARESFKRLIKQSVAPDQESHLSLIVSLALDSPDQSDPDFWYDALRESDMADNRTQASSLAELAWLKLEQGDDEAADRLFDELLSGFPTHPAAAQAGIARAKRFEAAEKFEQAAKLYAQVATSFADQPSGSVARLRHAYALHKIGTRGSLKQARESIDVWIEQAMRTDSLASDSSVVAEALYQAAWICEDLDDAPQRDQRFDQLVKNFPESKYWPDAAYRVARRHVSRREFDEAARLIGSIRHNQQSPARIIERSDFLLGQVNAKRQRWGKAAASFRKLFDKTDDLTLKNRASYWLAESLYRQNKFQSAGKRFAQLHKERAAELTTLRPWILLRSAQCSAKSESWQKAASTAKLAISEHPDFSLAYEYQFFVARGLEDAGLLNDAISGYLQVIDSPRGGSTETAAIAQWRIGEIRFHQEDYVAAIHAYYRVDSIFGYPRWRSAALLQAGKCQEHLENWKHAEKLYRQLLKLFPDSEWAADAQARLVRLQSVAAKDSAEAKREKQR